MSTPLLRQLSRVPAPWWFLAAIAPVLAGFLLAAANYGFPEEEVKDGLYGVRPVYPDSTEAKVTLEGTWHVDVHGAYPRAGDEPHRLVIETEPGPWRRLRLSMNGDVNDRWTVRISRDFHSIVLPGIRPGELIVLEGEELPGPPISESSITIAVMPRADAPPEGPVARVLVKVSPLTSEDRPPALPGALAGGLLPLALALFLSRAGRRPPQQALVLGALGGAVAIGGAMVDDRVLPFLWAAPAAFFLGTATMSWFRLRQAQKELNEQAAEALRFLAEGTAIAAILCFALWVRWEEFALTRNEPLLPDAQGYLEIAREGSFYNTAQDHAPWVREPLFPALLRGWIAAFPDTEPSGRFFTMLLGLPHILLIWLLGRRLFSPAVGLLAAAFAALSGFMATASVAGLRDDLLTVLFLGLMAVPVYTGEKRWWRAGLFGVAGGLLALTRLNALFLLIPFVALEAWRRRWHWGEVVLVFALAVPPVIPHFAFNARYSDGDYLFSSNVHTRYYLNRAMIGEPGFPRDVPEWDADPYTGEVVGITALVEHLGAGEMLWRTFRGYLMIFVLEYPHGRLFEGNKLLMIFGLFGIIPLWRRRHEMWWVILWFLLFLLPLAMIATIGLDRRLALPATAMILWVWAAGLVEVMRAIRWLAEQALARRTGTNQEKIPGT